MIYIIVNRLSGRGKGEACLKKAEALLQKRNLSYTVLASEYAGHCTALAKQACADLNCRKIIAIGGDGTFSEILNGMDLSVPIAFIPAGTGNDFVTGAALPTDTETALSAALDGHVSLFDYLTVNEKRCLNVAGTGFDVDVLLHEEKIRKTFPGKFSYMLALFRALLKLRFSDITLTLDDGEVRKLSVLLIAAANGKYYGGGLPICLSADCADGCIDVVLIKKLPRRAVPHVLLNFLKGRLAQMTKYVEIHRCKKVCMNTEPTQPVNMDGELHDGFLPATITVHSKRLQVMTF